MRSPGSSAPGPPAWLTSTLTTFGATRICLLLAFVVLAATTYMYTDTGTFYTFLAMVSPLQDLACRRSWVALGRGSSDVHTTAPVAQAATARAASISGACLFLQHREGLVSSWWQARMHAAEMGGLHGHSTSANISMAAQH